jgi:hypothetical protein
MQRIFRVYCQVAVFSEYIAGCAARLPDADKG